MATNVVSGVLAPQPLRIIRVIGGNLFRVAQQQYGDATQWDRIATANGISDPWLVGFYALAIPPALPNPTQGGAISVVG